MTPRPKFRHDPVESRRVKIILWVMVVIAVVGFAAGDLVGR